MLATITQQLAIGGLCLKQTTRGPNPPAGLFVFGDSIVDTGNHVPNATETEWNYPYGITWPGIPTGRVSDGRVFTDYFGNRCFDLVLLYISLPNRKRDRSL